MCFVYPGAKDAGEVVRYMVENTLTKAAPEHQWVDVRGDQMKGRAYVVARAHYLVDTPQGKLLGDFKIAASSQQDASVVCVLDTPGLYGAFERAVRGFLGSLQPKKVPGPKPVAISIVRGQIPGRLVTLERSYSLKKGGSKMSLTYSTTLAIGSVGKLSTGDDASAKVFTKGSLESGQYASAADGHTLYNLALKRESNAYKVAGVVQDKQVAGDLRYRSWNTAPTSIRSTRAPRSSKRTARRRATYASRVRA
jgi:hypothetical protein